MKIIISNNDVGVLLKTADSILAKYPSSGGDVPEKLKGLASLSAIKKTLSSTRFSICGIRNIADMNGIPIPSDLESYMATLHCVKYADMHPETREYLSARIIDLFRGNIAMSQSTYEIS